MNLNPTENKDSGSLRKDLAESDKNVLNTSPSDKLTEIARKQRDLLDDRHLKEREKAKETTALMEYLSVHNMELRFGKVYAEDYCHRYCLALQGDGFVTVSDTVTQSNHNGVVMTNHHIQESSADYWALANFKTDISKIKAKIVNVVEELAGGKEPDSIEGLNALDYYELDLE